MSDTIEIGDTVTFTYEGKIEDESTFHLHEDSPVAIEIGSKQLVPGLEKGIIGMENGGEKEFQVPPAEGYGVINPDLIQTVDLELLKQRDIHPELGMVIQTPHGNCHVTEMDGNNVKISYNHPLAGQTLTYSVKIVHVQKKSE